MKSRSISPTTFRNLGLAVLATLALGASAAQAENGSCLLDRGGANAPAQPMAAAPTTTPQFQEQMRLIEQGLRDGRITAYEAGRLMRQQWDMEQFRSQFRQGFLTATPARNEGCGLGNAMGGDLGASLGDMAKNGMQTAGSLMRSLMREGERLLKEPAETTGDPL